MLILCENIYKNQQQRRIALTMDKHIIIFFEASIEEREKMIVNKTNQRVTKNKNSYDLNFKR